MIPARPTGSAGLRRRLQIYLASGVAFVAIAAVALLLLRPSPEPYTPGAEVERGEEITRSLARALPPDAPQVRFTDATQEAGIRFEHFSGSRSMQLPEDMGSGLAWGDYDGDGDPDLFLVNESGPLSGTEEDPSAHPSRAALYRNEGNGRFTDVTADAGIDATGCGMGAAWGDYDGDGDLDLVVTRYGTNLLYRNDGDGTFTEISEKTGLGGLEGFWTGASWADFDRDGDLDLYICGYVDYHQEETAARRSTRQFETVVPYTLNPSSYAPQRNLLYRNDGGRFREIAEQAGVANPAGRSLSASWADFDGDGWPDLYVANDISDNAMFHNRRDGRFDDVSHAAWVADYRGAMGLAVGDWNNDGDLDIFVTHWIAQENALLENQADAIPARDGEPMHFVDNADLHGLGQIALDDIGWGTEFVDYDNDGRLDLFVVNGSTFQEDDDPTRLVPMRDRLFWNGGAGRGFFEVSRIAGEVFGEARVGRGAAFADYDDDGDLDVAVLNNGGPAQLLRNDGGNRNNWLRVVVRGPKDPSSPAGPSGLATTSFAIGALITVTTGDVTRLQQLGSSSSYLSQSPPGETWFGLGDARIIDRLSIAWPDGTEQLLEALPVNATIRIVQGETPTIVMGRRPARRREDVVAFWKGFREATSRRIRGDCAGATEAYEIALGLDPEHGDSLYYLGYCREEIGLHEAAGEAFRRLLALNSDSARGHVALGAHYAAGAEGFEPDLAAAERHLRRAQEINAEETGPLIRLGEIRLLRGDTVEAGSLLRDALRTNPNSVEAAFLLGYLAWEANDMAGARRYCLTALRAGEREAPVAGVLGEGDRRPGETAADRPTGGTIFTPLTLPLASWNGSGAPEEIPAEAIDSLYRPVRTFVREYGRGSSASP
jgi:tetratricopeptide (TPR) repeat protein